MAICSSLAQEEGGVTKRMVALPLDHVAQERIVGGAGPLTAIAMVAGGIPGARKAGHFVVVKDGSREGLGGISI